MVAIYQASQGIYDLFDKAIVLYEGRQIYFGPADEAREYFEGMGWYCPLLVRLPAISLPPSPTLRKESLRKVTKTKSHALQMISRPTGRSPPSTNLASKKSKAHRRKMRTALTLWTLSAKFIIGYRRSIPDLRAHTEFRYLCKFAFAPGVHIRGCGTTKLQP